MYLIPDSAYSQQLAPRRNQKSRQEAQAMLARADPLLWKAQENSKKNEGK